MKKLVFYLLFIPILAKEAGDFALDEIKAIVDGPLRTQVVAASDVTRRGFDGVSRNPNNKEDIKEFALEAIKAQHAEENGVSIGDEDVDKYLRSMSQGNEFSPESLVAMAKDFGFETVQELYDALKQLYGANGIMEQEIRGFLLVSEQDAQEYWEKHPEYKEGVYYLQTAHIPFRDDMKKKELKKALEHPETSPKTGKINWGVAFDVSYSELAEDKQFIKKMKIGEVRAVEVSDGFDLYRLKNHAKPELIPFAERRKAIFEKLQAEKFDKVFKQYNDDILKTADVTYLNV
ncbi:TPA: hypothetical protein DIC20_00435 [Candidatus Dependentiae bacterium]|nr:MAG: hypothetical protein US03_C0002G0062 [candidate division TM6 bacterium GW2011_GWF2_36_131]KKQ03496.1 MAG: hypothetical protein US13_C0002G0062 [candidate division TM6 bacterium GW2011_GWE2_36_25]KKQ20230.1 MAG: hypothetical protein US32_C0001G0127 [candidate division TM6 bacterium GW2011_GWA2_36_9]HBR70769.1 hypothetical protein [Candidatus Dependentiae bacterium]HCU00154.1 hypothetical protein [Candidatus Dependentiae bacterium]